MNQPLPGLATQAVAPFDLTEPLPTGTTLLEASAGTGKTYAIAALATRWIAEGLVRIDQLLLVTFSRNATRELRERVRGGLVRARDTLADPHSVAGDDDAVLRLLLADDATRRSRSLERLARAVAGFDAATIATTHEFCLSTLARLGIAASTDPGETLAEDISDIVNEVVQDFYLRKYGRAGTITPDISVKAAQDIAFAVVGDPQAGIQPADVGAGDHAADISRVGFAKAVRLEVERRRRARRLVTFDDLVMRLDASLCDPVTGPAACERLRDTYRVVLVDEFQDTDPAQWRILRTAFHGHVPLVLIGDPKQAIYAFRGADVFSYLDAAKAADRRATLGVNHRSDEPVVAGIDSLMGGLELGDPLIVVHPVRARRPGSRMSGIPGDSRVRLRLLTHPSSPRPPSVKEARPLVAQDVARSIVDLLSGSARIDRGSGPLPVQPGDIAVLVGNNKQGDLIHDALSAASVPGVVSAPRSVFDTDAAAQWLTLLRALEAPRRTALRAVALTDFLGHSPADLVLRGEDTDEAVDAAIRSWALTLEQDGVASLLARITSETALMSRVLSRADGERHVTDLRHVAAALHARQRAARGGVTGLLDWLEEEVRRARASGAEQTSELTRRLETDVEAVQILTIHRSKGLEFPVVYVPFAWDRHVWKPELLKCHDGHSRIIDVRTPNAPGRDRLAAAHDRELAGESLRMLYVAMTRASSLVIAHWSASDQNTSTAPLTRVLGARASGTTTPAAAYSRDKPEVGWLSGDDLVSVERVPPAGPAPAWTGQHRASPDLSLAPYDRVPDRHWRRTSYTGLTSALHDGGPADGGPEQAPADFRQDEPADDAPPADAQVEMADLPGSPEEGALTSPFAGMPAGASFGTLVHSVLEVVRTDTPDLPTAVSEACSAALAARPFPGLASEPLAQAIHTALVTPLGPLAGGRTLADIPPRDRLAELDFELPMGSGDDPSTSGTLARLADTLQRHLPQAHPLRPYPDRLRRSSIGDAVLRGYLTGSIDAVLRVTSPTDAARSSYLVVDYKTNLLRPPDPAPDRLEPGHLARDYRPSVLAAAMMDAHYPLQALLYCTALHRYLRWRVPDYDPARDLGGVLYLFLRGMAGAQTPTVADVPCGVFSWYPGGELVVELSDLLEGRRR